jgi:hypothetical protein
MADPTAVVGVILGAIALLLSAAQELRHRRAEKRDVRIKAFVGREFDPVDHQYRAALRARGIDAPPVEEPSMLCFVVTNVERRAVHLQSFGGESADGRHFVVMDPAIGLPRVLNEGEKHTFSRPLKLLESAEVRGLHFHDSLDNVWRVPHPDFLQLQTAARKAAAEERKKEREGGDPEIAADLEAARIDTEKRSKS